MLSPRRRKFAAEYVKNGFNGVQAVYSAGYKQGYNSACTEAWRLLRIAEVRKRVEEHIKKSKMSADEVLERLTEIAQTPSEFKGSDVVKAVELLGKGHKLFTDRVETSNPESSTKALLLAEIQAFSEEQKKSEAEIAQELHARFTDKSRKTYDPELDRIIREIVKESVPLIG